MSQEIERKWLCDGFPLGLKLLEEKIIFQSYIAVSPDYEVRVREAYWAGSFPHEGASRNLCIKTGNGLSRQEFEIELNQYQYNTLMRTAVFGKPITKHYKKFLLTTGEYLEISQVDRKWHYAEIEFASLEDAKAFKVPEDIRLGKEVTGNSYFAMKNYWKITRVDMKEWNIK